MVVLVENVLGDADAEATAVTMVVKTKENLNLIKVLEETVVKFEHGGFAIDERRSRPLIIEAKDSHACSMAMACAPQPR